MGALQAGTTSREFAEWMAYAQASYLPDDRADIRFAMLYALLVNLNRDPKKGKALEPVEVLRSLPWWPEESDEERAGKILATMKAIGGRGGATD